MLKPILQMRHYLDHASTSPLRPEARAAMNQAMDVAGDPGRIHMEGLEARHLVEESRAEIAAWLGAKPREVVFTSGATESIRSAIYGVMAKHADEKTEEKLKASGEIITSAIEHSAVLENVRDFPSKILPVDKFGFINPADLKSAITADTALVSIQHSNHEIGTLQNLSALIEVVRKAPHPQGEQILIHIDAAQSIGHIPFNFSECGADLVSVSAHKFGGPPGIGALLIRQGLRIEPLLKGGNQERARRGGMENVGAIAGFGAVAKFLTPEKIEAEAAANKKLISQAVKECLDIEDVDYYGAEQKIPHIACFGFSDLEPQAILLELDRKGISVHSGSACASEDLEPSPVLEAIGVDGERSLRVSVGWNSTKADIDAFVEGLAQALDYLRKLNL